MRWDWPLTRIEPCRGGRRPGLPKGLLCLLCLLLPLSACEGDGAGKLQDYLSRIARPLDQPVPEPLPRTPDLPPRWTALQQPVTASSLDGLDFLRLRGCALQQTVARRNSSLGRLAPPSQRLLLAVDFLREVDPCIDALREREEPALAGLLVDAAAQKRQQLPTLIFNATLGGDEFRQFWRGGTRADYPANTSSLVVAALEQLLANTQRWLDGDYRADGAAFELQLGDIAAGDGGELLAALAQQSAYLDAATALLEARAAAGALCPGDLRPAAADILRTVARKYFVTDVQRDAAALEQRAHQLLPPLRALEAKLEPTLPPAYTAWRDARDRGLAHWRAAPRRHVRGLQELLGGCFNEFAAAAG